MLIIYGALPLGGVETFLVRLAKERNYQNLKTKVLLLQDVIDNNYELFVELKKYAQVYVRRDIFHGPRFAAGRSVLLMPMKTAAASELMAGVDHVHVANGHHALVAHRLIDRFSCKATISVGFYHSLEFAWGKLAVPYYERVNRAFVLDHMPKENLLLFSESIIKFYSLYCNVDLHGAKTFRLGVLDRRSPQVKKYLEDGLPLKICSVGRLVEFKTYNLWMLKVVKHLRDKGLSVIYDIYGDGPLREKLEAEIVSLGLSKNVSLKGSVSYSKFDSIVGEYDIFVGSGTAIIQAAGLGVCSVVGVESSSQPESYGFFPDCADTDYNIGVEKLPRHSIVEQLMRFYDMSLDDKCALSDLHVAAVRQFNIVECAENFESIKNHAAISPFHYSKILYVASYFSSILAARLRGTNLYSRTREPIS